MLRLVVTLLACLLLAGTARAEAPPLDPCAAAAALDLTSTERELVVTLCQSMGASSGRALRPEDERRLRAMVQRLVLGPEWGIAALGRLLPSAVFTKVVHQTGPAPSKEPKAGPGCNDKDRAVYEEELARGLEDFVSKRAGPPEQAPPAFFPKLPRNVRCQVQARADQQALDGPLLTIFAPAGEVVRVFAGGTKPALYEVAPYPEQGRALELGGRSAHFLRLPVRTPYVITSQPAAERRPGERPLVLQAGRSDYDRTVWAGADEEDGDCLNIRIAAEAGAELFVDGMPSDLQRQQDGWSGIEWLGRSSHRVTVLQATSDGGPPSVLLSREIEAGKEQRVNDCVPVLHDLTSGGTKNLVGVLSVDAGLCVQAGIDSAKLDVHLHTYLRKHEIQARNLAAWSAAVSEIAGFKRALEALGGKAVGADRGNLDSVAGLASGAQELLRQGFASLLTVQLLCSNRSLQRRWDFSVVVQRVDLRKLMLRARDPLTGLDLGDVVRSEIEVITSPELIAQGIDASLSRIFELESLALREVFIQQPFHGALEIPVDVRLPPRTPQRAAYLNVGVSPLETSEARDVCDRIRDYGELRSRPTYDRLVQLKSFDNGSLIPLDAQHVEISTVVQPDPTAAKVLLFRIGLLRDDEQGKPREVEVRYGCADLSVAKSELWFDFAALLNGGMQNEAQRESYIGFGVYGGFDWRQTRATALGLFLSYSNAKRDGNSPSSWEDIGASSAAAPNGNLPYLIRENSIYAGPSWRARASVCEISLGTLCPQALRQITAQFRLLSGIGVRFVDKSQVPEYLTNFKRNDLGVTWDLLVQAQATLGLEVDSKTSLRAGASFGTTRLVDFFREPNTADVDPHLIVGISLGASVRL